MLLKKSAVKSQDVLKFLLPLSVKPMLRATQSVNIDQNRLFVAQVQNRISLFFGSSITLNE